MLFRSSLAAVVLPADARDCSAVEGAFPPRVADAPAALDAAGLADRARRPVLIFRTRFIMAPMT